MMKDPLGLNRRLIPVLGNVALLMMGLGLGFGMMELLLRANPNLVPREVRVNPPVRRVPAFVDENYGIKLSDGDLFHWMQGAIVSLSPNSDKLLAQVHLMTNAHGFRNTPLEKETYDIVALGDSFTRASGVAAPWHSSWHHGLDSMC